MPSVEVAWHIIKNPHRAIEFFIHIVNMNFLPTIKIEPKEIIKKIVQVLIHASWYLLINNDFSPPYIF